MCFLKAEAGKYQNVFRRLFRGLDMKRVKIPSAIEVPAIFTSYKVSFPPPVLSTARCHAREQTLPSEPVEYLWGT